MRHNTARRPQAAGHVDTIVVGLGAVGAACLLQLAKRGQRVLGIDRFTPPHALGSSHGETRITRCAIGEGEAYVPLVVRSHEIWRELEAETGMALLEQCGALILADGAGAASVHGKGDFVRRTIAAAERFGIAHDVLDASEIERRFPQIRTRGGELGYFEASGGFVRPERCIEAQLTVAARLGASTLVDTRVTGIELDGAGVSVVTEAGERYSAGEVVLAAGPWTSGLAGGMAPHLGVTRQVLHWFAVSDPAAYAPGRFPVFIWAHGNGVADTFYGFPTPPGSQGMKVATEQYIDTLTDPDRLQRHVAPSEVAAMFDEHVSGRLTGVRPEALRSAACMYTVTRDGDFLIGRAPENDRLLVVSACSGHGFKHSAGLGEAVAAALCDGAAADFAPFLPSRLLGVENMTAL